MGMGMRVSEVKEQHKINLEVVIEGKRYEFESMSIGVLDGRLLAEPVRVEEKVLSFSGQNVVVNLVYHADNSAPVIWKSVAVDTIGYNNRTMYSVSCQGEGKLENRRGSYRLTLDMAGVAQMGHNTKGMDVIVHDVSDSGFAILTKDDKEDYAGILVHLKFSDAGRNFDMVGIVVRKMQYREGLYLYGCKLNRHVAGLSQYIAERQRKDIMSQNEVMLEQHEPVGFGDLRRVDGVVAYEGEHIAVSRDDKAYLKSDRYKNVKLDENANRKKIDYDKYKGIKFE